MTTTGHIYAGGGKWLAANQKAADLCDAAYEVDSLHFLGEVEDRSPKSHRHLFAIIKDAWCSLPEPYASTILSPEHFRKSLLIRAGWCTEQQIICRSRPDAIRAMNIMQDMDEYALIDFADNAITIWQAKSMSRKSMDKETFQRIKDSILNDISGIIGSDCAVEYNERCSQETNLEGDDDE